MHDTNPLAQPGVLIAPSILNADFANLRSQIAAAEAGGADILHCDVMDGHFVPNLSFGPGILSTVNAVTDMALDTHLMIANPEKHVEAFLQAGADHITVHCELGAGMHEVLATIRAAGRRAGIALNPETPVSDILPFLSEVDMVLAMSVHPGFGGQSFIPETLEKLRELRSRIDDENPAIRLEVDGGLNRENMASVIAAGADVLVVGSSIFRSPNITDAVQAFIQQASSIAS